MNLALQQAKSAIDEGEVPVGAVYILHPLSPDGHPNFAEGEIISQSHNLTNALRNVDLVHVN